MLNPQIWIVEDDADDLDFFREAFKTFSSVVTMRYFQNGAEMLQQLRLATRPSPLLLLIDWEMPYMSGWEVIMKLRAEHPSLGLKIKLLSSGFTVQEQAFALEQGVPLHEKPVSVSGWHNLACYMVTEITNYRSYFPHALMQKSIVDESASRRSYLF